MEKEFNDEFVKDMPGSEASDFVRNKYRFNDEGKAHEHLLWSERKGEYEQLTGATTVIDVLGKILTWWAAELSAVECLEAGERIPTIREEYLEAVNSPNKKKAIDALQAKYPIFKKARFAHSVRLTDTAEAGTDLHAELEKYVKECIEKNEGTPFSDYSTEFKPVIDFSTWAHENVHKFLWSEGYCYNELLFVGGITDCGAEMKDGSLVIIDFKSAKEAYFNHFVQMAIYNLLIEKNGLFDQNGNSTNEQIKDQKFDKYIVIPFGAKDFRVVENSDVKGLKEAGLACVKLYREKSKFENN